MFSNTMLFILGGCLLGAIQLIAGITLGLWLRRPGTAETNHGRRDMLQAGEFARRLRQLADEMASSVGQHRTRLDEATRLLTTEGRDGEALAEIVVGAIGDVVRANHDLESKLQTAETRLEEQAVEIEAHISRSLTDPLTGLPNRREFNDRLEERMAAWNRRQEYFTLLLLDVDHFKKLNDEHGHLAGDQVLAAIGRILRCTVRREDAVARYGGEEFAILLPNTSWEQAVQVVQKIRETVAANSVDHQGQHICVTMSGGLATIGANERPDALIHRADAALYAAKAAGRNCAFVHDGMHCRPANDLQQIGERPEGFVAELVQLIHAPDVGPQASRDASKDGEISVGPYLPQETISIELAQMCEELRRHLAERGHSPEPATSESPSP